VRWRINTQTDKNVQIQLKMPVVHNKGVNPKVRSCLVWGKCLDTKCQTLNSLCRIF